MKFKLEIPENSRIMQRFRVVHPRLYKWYHTALGKKYLEQQYKRINEEDLGERMIQLNDIGVSHLLNSPRRLENE